MIQRPAPDPPLEPLEDVLSRGAIPPWEKPDRLLFASPVVRVGAFRADPKHPRFRDSGPIGEPLYVFPRTAVRIEHAGHRPFVADSRIVTYYNAGQIYWRTPVDPAGDHCEWFWLRSDVLLPLLREVDPSVVDRPGRPFARPYGPGDPRSYIQQRTLVRYVKQAGDAADTLVVEETAIQLLRQLVGPARREAAAAAWQRPAHRELAERLKAHLGTSFHQQRSLAQLSAAVGCSPFYLARVFRAVEGTTIHQHRLTLRLTRSLERVAAGQSLRAVAFDVGFSSPSHFASTFHRVFGITPSRFRRRASLRLLGELSARAGQAAVWPPSSDA